MVFKHNKYYQENLPKLSKDVLDSKGVKLISNAGGKLKKSEHLDQELNQEY